LNEKEFDEIATDSFLHARRWLRYGARPERGTRRSPTCAMAAKPKS